MDTIECGMVSFLSFFSLFFSVWFGQHVLEDVMGEEMTDNDLDHMTTYYKVWKQLLLLIMATGYFSREQFGFCENKQQRKRNRQTT